MADEGAECAGLFASRLAPTIGSVYERNNQVGCKAASRASFAPTDLMGVRPQEPGRLSGRLAFDFDLGRPVNHDGRTQVLRSGHLGMDAEVAALGHGWPFAAGPRSNAGVEGMPSLSEAPSGGASLFCLLFLAFEKK
jgi:hypothetical protein